MGARGCVAEYDLTSAPASDRTHHCVHGHASRLGLGGEMGTFLWIGSALGAAVGLVHGVYLYRQQVGRAPASDPTGNKAAGLYYGLWAVLLWTIFGAYVLAFWILGAVAWPVAQLIL